MIRRAALAALALALTLAAPPARAAGQACTIAIEGPVKASFGCKASFLVRGDGAVRILITPGRLPRSVKALLPGEVELPAPVQPGTYGLDRLATAKVLLTGPRHATFAAEKSKRRTVGDVAVTLTRAENVAGGHERLTPSLSGKLEARLAPASPSARGEARVTIAF